MNDLFLKHLNTNILFKSGTNLASEARLYIYQKQELLKIFTRKSTINNKEYIVDTLIKNYDLINHLPIVLPTGKVFFKNNFVGYRMPFYEHSINISAIVFDKHTSLSFKLNLLKEVITLILKVEEIPELQNNFFLGDIYGNNFIWDMASKCVRCVDIDGSYIMHSASQKAFHLDPNSLLKDFSKYPKDSKTNYFLFNHNTMILCFIYMLVNTLAQIYTPYWPKNAYFEYLDYLKNLGLDKELLGHLEKIYNDTEENSFYPELLDTIDTQKDYRLKR